MMAAVGMVAGCLGSCLLLILVVPASPRPELLFGMLGPLAAVATSWILIERASRRDAVQVTSVLMKSFLLKFVFFGIYVAVMIRGLALRPVPFIMTFTGYFLALYAVEALLLQRLSSRGLRGAR